ncbi:MAG: 4Fe-4S ferredoxin [Firmicutes bacterium HGW-Firmicutes-11]|jgi:polyferredoxin|nr:MAG: 4Fe-4S ferredoxin [Firmicutes bacterium HGW-Firmicutes-11]
MIQGGFSFLTNAYLPGFLNGSIFTGPTKIACVPGLSCYSCPGALGSCPIGAMQFVLGSRDYSFSLYITGFLVTIGALSGRFTCGWLCPFGLLQDLLHKIPFRIKILTVKGDRYLRLIKYALLLVFVILFPLFVLDIAGQGEQGFCKWICPSGTIMAGWPLVAANDGIRNAIGFLFAWKNLILIALLLISIVIYRPFCRYLCPLGAIYGWFNPVALYRFHIDEASCDKCGICQNACKLNIPVFEKPNSPDCIRCNDCIHACPNGSIQKGIAGKEHPVYDSMKRIVEKEGDPV